MLDILERQQKLTTNQWKIISAAILGDMLDFFDYGLIAFALAFIVGHWKLTYGQSAMILLARPGSVPSPVPSCGVGWPIASADARCSLARRSISRSSPASWR